jgi:hypothetical protein
MRVFSLKLFVLAALGLATAAAVPRVAHADEVTPAVDGEVAAPAIEEPSMEEPSAAPTDAPPGATPKSCCRPTTEGPWRFVFAGYGWLPNAPADIKLNHGDATLPEDFGTIFDSLQFGAMLDLELRKGSFGAYFAPIVVFLDDSEIIPGVNRKVTLNENVYLMDFGLTYELGRWQLWNHDDWILPSPKLAVELNAGGRALIDDMKIKIERGQIGPGRTFEPEISFVAPVFGLRAFWDLTDRLNLRMEGDYGGFDVDNLDETYNAMGLVGWRFKPKPYLNINVYAGYRFLHIDYKKFVEIEVDIKGPFVGLAFEFSSE